jgi:hypothetical protein
MGEERKKGARRMKTSARVIFPLLLAVLFQHAACAANVKTYRNQTLGFEISYLDTWEQSQAPGNPSFFIKRKSVKEPSSISINVANFTGNKGSFMREIKAHPEKFIEKYKQRFPSAEMLESGDTYLGSFPGYFISTNYTLKNLNVEIDIVAMQVFCIKGKRFYLVTFETPLLLFEKTFNEFQAMLASFNFR